MGLDAMILVFWMLSFKATFSLSSFTLIKRLFSSCSLSAIKVVSSTCLRLLIFLPAILIPTCASSNPAFSVMCSVCKLNKPGWQYTVLTQFFPNFEPVCCSVSSSNYCFLTCIQASQEAGQVVWYSHLLKNLPQFPHSQRLSHSHWSRSRCFSGIPLFFLWSNGCWQFGLWFPCLS